MMSEGAYMMNEGAYMMSEGADDQRVELPANVANALCSMNENGSASLTETLGIFLNVAKTATMSIENYLKAVSFIKKHYEQSTISKHRNSGNNNTSDYRSLTLSVSFSLPC